MPNKIANKQAVMVRAVAIGVALTWAGALTSCSATQHAKDVTAPRTQAEKPDSGDACGAQSLMPVRPVRDPADIRAEIEERMATIATARGDAGLDEEFEAEFVERMAGRTVVQARGICERPDEPTLLCQEVCKLADSICDNAENICRLAGELGNDAWANERCQQATTACGESSERCCACR